MVHDALQTLRLGLSKGPHRVGILVPSPEDGNRSTFRNVLSFIYYSVRWKKSRNPVILGGSLLVYTLVCFPSSRNINPIPNRINLKNPSTKVNSHCQVLAIYTAVVNMSTACLTITDVALEQRVCLFGSFCS
jgi:hypothetical protein